MFLIREDGVVSLPKNVKPYKDKVILEVILQTAGDYNRNRRKYPKDVLEESVQTLQPRIKEGSLLGELDHPTEQNNPARQFTVLYKYSSHKFLEIGWDGNNLIGTIETLAATLNGQILRDLVVKDGVPVGFSYRGAGELKTIQEGGKVYHEVRPPLQSITWDSVSFPSHPIAKMIKLRECDCTSIREQAMYMFNEITEVTYEDSNMICTKEGVCYLPTEFEKIVDTRIKMLKESFNVY